MPTLKGMDVLKEAIRQQEVLIDKVESRRIHVSSLIQKGKELMKESPTDMALQEQICHLESLYAKTLCDALERLKDLQGRAPVLLN